MEEQSPKGSILLGDLGCVWLPSPTQWEKTDLKEHVIS